MNRTINHRRIAVALSLGLAAGSALAIAGPAAAQQASSRFRVLVPAFAPQGGADDDFGKDIAEEVRDRIDELPTHAPFEGGDLKAALKKYDVDEDELSDPECVKARQLASLVNIELVMCGSYQQSANGMTVNASIISPKENDSFDVPEFTASDPEQAAEQIVQQFNAFVQVLSFTTYCHDYLNSQQWTQALENCNKALASNPKAKAALYGRGSALWKMDSLTAALESFQKLIEVDQLNTDALLAAGLVATALEQPDIAREYFKDYLELNPGSAEVRLTIAGDIAQAGDPEAALMMVEEGITGDTTPDLSLIKYAGQLALGAAVKRGEERGANGEMPPEERALYEKSLMYLDQVFKARADSMDATLIGNMAAVLNKLGEYQRTIDLAQRAIQQNAAADPNLWLAYGESLKETGDIDGAIEALRTAVERNPEAQVYSRMTLWLIEAGRVTEAVEPGQHAVQRGELDTNELATMIAGIGYSEKGKANQHAAAIEHYEVARQFATSEEAKAYVNFFHGYAVFQQAVQAEAPGTAESAKRALPLF
ncbi:MAG: tetratricopeptide repeat protein, partial [Longimicrobiales bacterium]